MSSYGLDVGRQRSGRVFNHRLGLRKHRIEKMSSYVLDISKQCFGKTMKVTGTGKVPEMKKAEMRGDKPTSTIVMPKIQ